MKKNKVVKIVKIAVLCLVTALTLDCPTLDVFNPLGKTDYSAEEKRRRTIALGILGKVINLTADKDNVLAPESYTISWEYNGLETIGFDPSYYAFIADDKLFFVIARSLSPNETSLIPPTDFNDKDPNKLAFVMVPQDSTSVTFPTTDTKSTITIYHAIYVTDIKYYSMRQSGGLAPVTVFVDNSVKLDISKSQVKPGQSYTLSWNRLEGMSGYELVVSNDRDFHPERTTTTYQGNSTSYTASAPEDITGQTAYFFRVRAVSDAGATDWSNTVMFNCVTSFYQIFLYAPKTEVKVNEPFQLRYWSPTLIACGGDLLEETPEGHFPGESKWIEPKSYEQEITLTRTIPNIYSYQIECDQWEEYYYSNKVYVTVLPDIQPLSLSVSSNEVSFLEEYTLSSNSQGDVGGYEWQEYAGDISNPLVTRTFPKQVLEWVCAHRVAAESTFLYRMRSFSPDPDAPGEKIFEDWSPVVQVTVQPLQSPTGLAVPGAAYGMTSEITWNGVPHADRYKIEMTSGGSSIFLDSETTGISHKFESLGELTIRVQAISGTDESAWSAPLAVTVAPAPAPVATLSADQVDSNEPYTLDWTIAVSEGLQAFIIEETIGSSSGELEIQPGERSRTFSHETMSALTCTYRIKARYSIEGATVDTDWSNPVSLTINPLIATPDAPVLSVSKSEIQSGESVKFSWNAVDNATSYELINMSNGATNRVPGTSNSITVTLENNTMDRWLMMFSVIAINESGGLEARSSLSNVVHVSVTRIPPGVAPDAPVASGSKSEIQSGESVTISWNAVTNATSYELRNMTTGKTYEVSGTSITVTLVNDVMDRWLMWFSVTAINESGGQVARSSMSNIVFVTVTRITTGVTPEAPYLTVSPGQIQSGESVTISWSAVDFATVYELNNITTGTTTSVSGNSRTVTLTNDQQTPITYQFTVTAVNESGGQEARSSQSNMVSVEVAPAPIATPEAPHLTIDEAVPEQPHYFHLYSGESATLRWNAVANATSYEITYYETDFNFNRISGPTTTSVAGTSFTVTLYNSDWGMYKFYEYTVTALNESGGQVARSTASNKVYISVGAQ